MQQLGEITNLAFHLYMIFILFFSGAAVFALLRFGQSRVVSLLTALFYISLVSSLYFQTLALIAKL